MHYEVENKFSVADLSAFRRQVEGLGGRCCGSESHVDSYFNHPLKDFRQTDEALRIRESNPSIQITYKGPRADSAIKIREEIELPMSDQIGNGERAKALFSRLGFRFVACVKKRRTRLQLDRGKWLIAICLDEVEELGSFVEIELLADFAELEPAKQVLSELQTELGLGGPIMTSYLRMLVAKQSTDESFD